MKPVVRDERRKLFATYLNTIAAGFIVAPLVSFLFCSETPAYLGALPAAA